MDRTIYSGIMGLSVMLFNVNKLQAIINQTKFLTPFVLRRCFIITHINIKKDQDGLLLDTRGLLVGHKYVRVPNYLYMRPVEKKIVSISMKTV